MSHIPNSAMTHAGPSHHEDAEPVADAARDTGETPGIGTGAWIAIGGTLLAGAAAAIAVPLLRSRAQAAPGGRGRKSPAPKGKPRKAKA